MLKRGGGGCTRVHDMLNGFAKCFIFYTVLHKDYFCTRSKGRVLLLPDIGCRLGINELTRLILEAEGEIELALIKSKCSFRVKVLLNVGGVKHSFFLSKFSMFRHPKTFKEQFREKKNQQNRLFCYIEIICTHEMIQ